MQPYKPYQPAPEPRRRDSWEYYSTDEEDALQKPRSQRNPIAQANPPTDGPQSQPPIPASLRVGGGPKPPTVAAGFETITKDDVAEQRNDEKRPDDGIPSALRPGGGVRVETNPFLRKSPQNPAMQIPPPTESLASMGLGESESNLWHPPTPKTQNTAPSSTYSSMNAHDGSDAYVVDPNRPPIPTILPVHSPAADSPQQAYMMSPLEIQQNPWTSNTTNIPLSSPSPPQQLKPALTGSNNPFLPPSQTPTQTPPQSSPAPIPGDRDPFAPMGPIDYPAPPGPPPHISPIPSPSPALMSVPSDDDVDSSVGGLDKKGKSPARAISPPPVLSSHAYPDDDGMWDDLGSLDKGKGKAVELPAGPMDTVSTDDWNLVDVGPKFSPGPPAASHSVPQSVPQKVPQSTPQNANYDANPSLPPRQSGEASRWTPPRAPVDSKAETYEVKKIRWHDVNAPENPRTSPILVQNENGPCPLLALVNALSLTTPANVDDGSLVSVLRSREQISLNLLLDAVFEELMSPRRTDADGALPDVSELYAFLQSLHTGMNVNPRYVPTPALRDAFMRTSLTHLGSAERDGLIPGTFENTHEMSLYAAFKIPLIHGWLPPNNEPTYDALERHAPSYEDAQNLLFREEELDAKLSSADGLTPDEQQLYQDLITIKHFLAESATQLTAWGIHVITKVMKPGGCAILFRNDHFSTVYCHPQTKQLVNLVTDYGYRSHEEVVWESLVDINGERTQYLSGDFRVVGSAGESTGFGGYSEAHGSEWTTVDSRRGRGKQQEQHPGNQSSDEPPLSAAEQEDRDLALALQLQEEEDQRHREEVASREREQYLSNRVIEQQGRPQQGRQQFGEMPATRNAPWESGPAPPTPARPTVNTANISAAPQTSRPTPVRPTSQQVRPLIPPRRNIPPRQPEDGGEAPPTYEMAAHDELYSPPPGHPNHPSSTPGMSRQSTATSVRNAPAQPVRQGQRVSGQTIGQSLRASASNNNSNNTNSGGRDKDCIVM